MRYIPLLLLISFTTTACQRSDVPTASEAVSDPGEGWVIALGAFKTEEAAKIAATKLRKKGVSDVKVLWMGDYTSLGKKDLWSVYSGPFPKGKPDVATTKLQKLKQLVPDAYGLLLSKTEVRRALKSKKAKLKLPVARKQKFSTIYKQVKRMESKTHAYFKDSREVWGASTEGGEMIGISRRNPRFAPNHDLKMVEIFLLGEMGRSKQVFFFSAGKLIFVFEHSTSYSGMFPNVGGPVRYSEDHLYFLDERLERWLRLSGEAEGFEANPTLSSTASRKDKLSPIDPRETYFSKKGQKVLRQGKEIFRAMSTPCTSLPGRPCKCTCEASSSEGCTRFECSP